MSSHPVFLRDSESRSRSRSRSPSRSSRRHRRSKSRSRSPKGSRTRRSHSRSRSRSPRYGASRDLFRPVGTLKKIVVNEMKWTRTGREIVIVFVLRKKPGSTVPFHRNPHPLAASCRSRRSSRHSPSPPKEREPRSSKSSSTSALKVDSEAEIRSASCIAPMF